jgi:predicted DNA-binding protein (MmcQ/YjbR family)
MPLTFTAPIEEIPGLIALTLQSSDRKSALEVPSTTGRFPSPWANERNWSPLVANMTVEQVATLKRLAESAYELDAFKPKLTRAEADQRIAMLTAKLKLLDEPPHTL